MCISSILFGEDCSMKTIILAACLAIGLQVAAPMSEQPHVYNLPCYEQYKSVKMPYKATEKHKIINLRHSSGGDNNGFE